ncbi:NUDIX domain-containing protein [Phytoactinopolyspora alkaliphila]|uniref:NUDIX domain-containing protein n=1 Tax=Phytoactinopolyspora alkaliphila TaxID=1783498 RepID=A0A6N9YI36_9ACTN|nr:NUDIX domain-containing protein [Phytoactinopolyspora alkaliphila]NED94666.1 NUDIX domain-containing protein [Phytoactinopolyspora alkaliphila]
MSIARATVEDLFAQYHPNGSTEIADVGRAREFVATAEDPWSRHTLLHLTGSAIIVHPPTRRVLLRWHPRQGSWMQIGGHGDPGETDPVTVALREGKEETGLSDLVPWPDANVVQVVIVPVPANAVEPAHEHVDVRFVLATAEPDAATPESPDAPLRWLGAAEAREATHEENVREMLMRVERLLAVPG